MVKYMLVLLMLLNSLTIYAQKQTYDVTTYQPPAGWTIQQGSDYISYSKIDGSSWAQITIYQDRSCNGDVQGDFDKDWKELVAGSKNISGPDKTAPQSAEGWTVMSGSGVWQYNGANVATILTIYSNNRVCVSVLCNATAQPYLKDYQTLISSLNINADNITPPSSGVNNVSIAGLWTDYTTESNGSYNGFPQLTGGYFRREYLLKADGTYIFRAKDWGTTMADILFIYETGTWLVNGNQLTITPVQGRGGWWAKAASGRTGDWGSLKKAADYTPETVTYTFSMQYLQGEKETFLVLENSKGTQRDRGGSKTFKWSYRPRALDNSLIDNPPGFNTY